MKAKSRSSFVLLGLIMAPLMFSIGFSRLYNESIFLLFPSPGGDDEQYFDHLNVWFGNHRYSPVAAPLCEVPKNWRGIGAASLWIPGYLMFKWGAEPLKRFLDLPDVDGDQLLRIGAATSNYLTASAVLLLTFPILARYVTVETNIVFTLLILFGGLAPYYFFRRPLISHPAETFYFILTIFGIERIKSDPKNTFSYAVSALGLAGLVCTRFQLMPVVAGMIVLLAYNLRRQWRRFLVLLLVFVIPVGLQLAINRLSYGRAVIPPAEIRPFMTPVFLFEIGRVQLQRLIRLFIGKDWGLLLMFPWVLFGIFVTRHQWRRLSSLSAAWLLPPILSILPALNYKAHGASYGHRYVNLLVIALGFLAGMGYDSFLQRFKARRWAYLILGAGVFVSLTHYVAFESDKDRFTLLLQENSIEGPQRVEWTAFDSMDWVNGRYSENVYGLFLHPLRLVEKYGAAPLPLYLGLKVPPLLHRATPPKLQDYVQHHRIDFKSYWRYALILFFIQLAWFAIVAGFWGTRFAEFFKSPRLDIIRE